MIKRFVFAFYEFKNTTQIPGRGEFLAEMVGQNLRKFAEDGYFPKRASIFHLFNEADNVGQFVSMLADHLQGFLDMYTLYILENPRVIEKSFLPKMDQKHLGYFYFFLNRSHKQLKPDKALNYLDGLGLDREAIEKVVSEHFNFNFPRAIRAVSNLAWALDNKIDSKDSEKVELQAKLLRVGPDILRRVARVYDTPNKIYTDDSDLVSAQATYPTIAEELKRPLNAIANFMETLLYRHPQQLVGGMELQR